MQGQRHQPDYILFFTVVILCAVGVVTVFSASTYFALDLGLSASHFAVRQLIAAVIGLGLMMGVMQIPYLTWYKWAPRLMLVNLLLLAMVIVPGIGVSKAGSRRWLGHGSITFQPSEFALIILALYLAFFFSKKVMFLHSFKKGLLPALIVIALNAGLILLEPDMGTSLTLIGTAVIMALASGTRLKPLLFTFLFGAPVLVGVAFSAHYRSSRLTSFLHPFANPTQSYQLLQGWTGIVNGGWFGRGFGMSIEKTGYLPVPHIDFIFPVFVEEWGIVGACALLVVFGVLIWRGFLVARHADTRFGSLLALGLTATITVGMFINLGAVTGLLPVTGIPLPFISYGGTSLVMSLVAMGMLLGVSRYTLAEEPESDELADVIEVDEARERIESRTDELLPVQGRPRRVAEIHPLRPRRKTAARESWRARQEAAATGPRAQRSARKTDRRSAGGFRASRTESTSGSRWARDDSPISLSGRPAARSAGSMRGGRRSEAGRAKDAGRKSRSTVQASSSGPSWRERNSAAGRPQPRSSSARSSGSKPGAKRGIFRRDR
ncbi:FtsW/RodA/SpoVE family cell cycle protein [Alicyclobacillus cycloheptanicus]|uniref:Probable peptidoglycan glycosyltransferase FtsW n=1 Tax=Alicyclobacillus cycloheptanicus TaxID=1457 RepID=A0ABT9XFM7_9BACL|nr:FtsW/RodA/SpoVE family cell cycle protein [Alicyclobacillus cycloheptanicus]MDQ0188987.1 cell division protein FtsW [Alicyclobacillus cycloheptanicus]WDM01670.1 FtsW/RodA/SpoVE family cell cycle protein [Alicyclobacillus cycloheptanicus]